MVAALNAGPGNERKTAADVPLLEIPMTARRNAGDLLVISVAFALVCCPGAGLAGEYAKGIRTWGFRIVHARTRALQDGGVLGVENSSDGRGFYRSNPISVTPGARYGLSVACRTENAPAQCAFARVFWYQGPDRGRQSAVRRCDDTIAIGGTVDWTVLKSGDALTVPEDATVAVLRLESSSAETEGEEVEQVALAGRTVYQVNWHTLLTRKGITFRNCGEWLDPALFEEHKLVILCNAGPGRKLSDQENDIIQGYLEGGGHLILTIATPYSLAGGKDVNGLSWLGAGQCRYGHLGKEFLVVDNADALTSHLELGDRVYTTSGKVGGLRLPEGRNGLVGKGDYCFIVSRPLGEGRVTFFGNSPPADKTSQPLFHEIIERTLAEAGIESDADGGRDPFRVWFKDVTFAEVEE